MKYSLNWGLTTSGYPAGNLAQAAVDADQYDIRFLEPQASREDPALLLKLARVGRIRVLGTDFGLAVTDAAEREKLDAAASLADRAGVPYLRTVAGFDPGTELTEDLADRFWSNMEWFDSLDHGCRLAVETLDGMSSARCCAEIFSALGLQLPVIWNAHHTWRVAGESPELSFELLNENVVAVHFMDSTSDSTGERITAENPGKGDVPLQEIFSLLEKAGADYPVCLDQNRTRYSCPADMDEALRTWKHLF